MKRSLRILSALFSFVFLLSAVSCSGSPSEKKNELTIVTTIFPPYDFARQIADGADGVKIEMLLPPGSESHDYEPSVSDIALVGEADLIICVGGETDEWIYGVIKSSKSRASVLRLTDMVELLEEDESVLVTGGHSHEHHHEHGEDCVFDEHVWTSPENAAAMTESIAEEMCRLSEKDHDTFTENAQTYAASLREVEKEMKALTDGKDAVLLFSDRFPFRYLANSIGADCHAAFAGCASDSEASLEAVYRLCEIAKNTNARVIFTCEFSSRNAAEVISRETGCTIRELHSCHNVSREDFNNGITCLELMRRNLSYLKEALG